MDLSTLDISVLTVRLATAGLIGLAVGLEREWSGHASGPHGRFAGIRTFLLLGLVGGVAGILLISEHEGAGVAVIGGAAALSIAAYVSAVRRQGNELDGTTEIAAIVVVALGVLAALGDPWLAGGTGAIGVFALGEKKRVHAIVHHISQEELEAALQYAVLALVVLPLLPKGPYGGILAIEPRTIWELVLVFSGLNFAGYVARRVFGAHRGYGITGILGGLVSSTAVTLQFSRYSRVKPELGQALAGGVVGACTVLLPRVLAITAVLAPPVALALLPMLAIPLLIGVAAVVMFLRDHVPVAPAPLADRDSPLGLWSAMYMAVAFQVAISVIAVVRRGWGVSGVYTAAVALGLTDMDALTVSMSRNGGAVAVSAKAIMIGILSNTLFKLVLGASLGTPGFRRRVVAGLSAMAVGTVVAVWLF